MSAGRLWRKAVGPFREFGLAVGTLYVVDRLLRRLSPSLGIYAYELMVQRIGPQPLLAARFAKNLRFTEIGRDHPDVASMPARPEIKEARFKQGAVCLGAYRKDVLIGYVWFCAPRYEEDEVRCTYEVAPAASSVFDFDLYVLPEHRMGIGFIAVWHGASGYLRERGIRRTFSRMTRFNTASRRSHLRLGSQTVARVFVFKARRVELLLTSIAPYVRLTLASRARLVLKANDVDVSPEIASSDACSVAKHAP